MRMHNWVVIVASGVLLLGVMWIAGQGGFTSDPHAAAPGTAAAKFAANIYLILESLPALAVVWAGAAGLGYPIRRWLLGDDRPYAAAAQVGTGMAALLLLNWLAAWAGLLGPIAAWALPGVGVALLGLQLYRHSQHMKATGGDDGLTLPRVPASLLLMMPGAAMLLVAAACPPGTLWRVEAFGYDVLSYHLQIPREWLAAGGMVPLRHNVYSFLPGLLEATYAHLGAMRGSMHAAIYTCQLFHASLAIYAAVAAGCAVAQLTGPMAGGVAAGALLATPWTLITGSLAYNEMAVAAIGAAALLILLDTRSDRPGAAAVIGLLAGAATLAKPTAGPMLAVPIGLVLLTRLNHAHRWRPPPDFRRAVIAAAVAGAVGAVVLSPWLIRNAAWTGNPVFPFATALLGTGHWSDEVAQRWDRGHGLTWGDDNRLEAIGRQWLGNTGYGAVGGQPTPRETRNIARFDREYGWPVLWGAVLLAGLLTVRQQRLRRAVGAMLLILTVQVGFWLVATHLQSRFLITTLLPACIILGIGAGLAHQWLRPRVGWGVPAIAALLVGTLTATSLTVLWNQTQRGVINGQRVTVPPMVWIDSLAMVDQTAMDDLPMGSKVYLVADNSSLLYIDPPIDYHSAFDTNPLGDILRTRGDDPAAVTGALRERGITHVWVHWSELDRLHNTYGFDPAVTEPTLRALATTWRTIADLGGATLYQIDR